MRRGGLTGKRLVGLILEFKRLGLVILGDFLVEDEIVLGVRVDYQTHVMR